VSNQGHSQNSLTETQAARLPELVGKPRCLNIEQQL